MKSFLSKIMKSTSYNPEIINGVFTVNAEGKKVKFAKGNLFWNGTEFRCEKNQYDYPKEWNRRHVGHFFWNKNDYLAKASLFFNFSRSNTDKFFASDNGAIEGYTVLNQIEWNYLLSHALAKNSSGENTIVIAGINCIVLKPDGFSGTVADSYTAEQWTAAEEQYGLVALPFAGWRYDMAFDDSGSNGSCWSGTPHSNNSSYAYYAYFNSNKATTFNFIRDMGRSVRLVQVQ